jgi:hypothetical protein
MHPGLVISIGCGPLVVRISRCRFRERKDCSTKVTCSYI